MARSILTKRQEAFLDLLGADKQVSQNFYLTGGTTLAGLYLYHRYSEDLDFFSETEFSLEPLNIFLKDIQPELKYTKIDYQQSFNRNLFFLHFPDEVLKVEFTYFPFPRIEQGREYRGVQVDSLRDIAVNKIFTIYQQTRARDYIDLYYIHQEKKWTITELVKQARAKFDWHIDPLQLGAQLVKATEAKDYPRMIQELNPKVWQNFFIEEAKKLKPEVLD